MNIPKYWARSASLPGGPGGPRAVVSCWQSSDQSVDEAQRLADARAIELTQRFQAGSPLDRYSYGDRPLREEIVQSIPGPSGDVAAVITRNLYGALILNTARAMFIDVDFPDRQTPDVAERNALNQLNAWAAARPQIGLRVYRTCAGLRCLATHQTYDPASPDAIDILQSIGSDPLYVRLCKAQACFRARLTPKPWRLSAEPTPPATSWLGRLGLGKKPKRAIELAPRGFPWLDAAKESRFRDWQRRYDALARNFSVCRLVSQIGQTTVLAEIQPIIALHDQHTAIAANRTLV